MPDSPLSYTYDLFVSYARIDDRPVAPDTTGWITAFVQELKRLHRSFHGSDRIFFDRESLESGDDWERRLLEEVRDSALLLIFISPAYFASSRCRWEWSEYVKHELDRGLGDGGVHPVYYIEVPAHQATDLEDAMTAWIADVQRRQQALDLRPWNTEGVRALERLEVRRSLERLQSRIDEVCDFLTAHTQLDGNVDAHNPNFVGRRDELTHLAQMLSQASFTQVTLIQSAGGMGKTSLANEYAHLYGRQYAGGRWLARCSGKSSLGAALEDVALAMGIRFTELEQRDSDAKLQRILRELRQFTEAKAAQPGFKSRCLIILDNIDLPPLLSAAELARLPKQPWLHLLATTRLAGEEFPTVRAEQVLRLDKLSETDALRLIEQRQPDGQFRSEEDRTAALDIVRRLDGYTLEVESVAVYLGCYPEISCEDFRERDLATLSELSEDPRVAMSVRHPDRSLEVVFRSVLQGLTPEEQFVLGCAAHMPPDAVAISWLKALAVERYPHLGVERTGYPSPWGIVIRKLTGRRLLTGNAALRDPASVLRMHRRAQQAVRAVLRTTSPELRASVIRHWKGRVDLLWDHWDRSDCRWEADPLARAAELLFDEQDPAAPLIANQVSEPLRQLGHFAEAKRLLEQAILHTSGQDRDDNPVAFLSQLLLATCYSNLALVEQRLGNRQEALKLVRRALSVERAFYPPDHPTRATRYSNLAQLVGVPNTARALLKRAIAIDTAAYGESSARVAADLRNLAAIERDAGNPQQAKDLLLSAIGIFQAAPEPSGPELAATCSILGLLEQETGNLPRAEELMRESLEHRVRAYDSAHPDMANGHANLARVLIERGKVAEAEQHARQALSIWKASEVPEDTRSGKAHWTLGRVALLAGDRRSALPEFEEALRLLRLGHTEDHPWIEAVRSEIASLA